MPIVNPLLLSDDEMEESAVVVAPDPVNLPTDPAAPLWLLEQLWTVGVLGRTQPVATFLVGEFDNGYMELAPRFPDEPTEDTRDWGMWAFHGVRTYDNYED